MKSAVLLYGIAMMILGVIGYMQGSAASLYAGTGTGLLIVISSLFVHKKGGAYATLILVIALTTLFTIRYAATSKSLPGILALLSAAMLIYLLVQIGKWRK